MTNYCYRQSGSWAPKIYYYFAWLAVVAELQCYAFKPLIQGSTLSDDLLRSRGYYSWHRLSSLTSLYSIRGGTSDDFENEYDEDETSYFDFIASFESELAEIRREAELEAENEMKKIRGLIVRRDDDDEQEEEFIRTEYHGGTDRSNENDQYDGFDGDSDVPTEEYIEPSSDMEEINQSTYEGGLVFHGGKSTKQQDIEEYDEDKGGEEIDGELNDGKTAIQVDGDLIGGGITESEGTSMDDFTSANKTFGSSRELKPKASKSKSKVSKKKKKKAKSRIDSSVQSDITDAGRGDVIGESVLQTHTRESDEDIAQTRQSGVWYYLRSDLGRALCLFIATIIVAILTKRLERQMEAEGII